MSCDYAVWHTDARLTSAQACDLYHSLCEGDTSGVSPSGAIDTFYAELTALHPEIGSVKDNDIDNQDTCPWSIAFDRSPGHLIICCVWPKADYIGKLVRQLSKKHGLAMFDPQSERILYPGDPDRQGLWQAIKEDREFERDPWWANVGTGFLLLLVAAIAYQAFTALEHGVAPQNLHWLFSALYRTVGKYGAVAVLAIGGFAFLWQGLGQRRRKAEQKAARDAQKAARM